MRLIELHIGNTRVFSASLYKSKRLRFVLLAYVMHRELIVTGRGIVARSEAFKHA